MIGILLRLRPVVVAAATLLPLAAHGATIQATELYSFGDSLTDTGLAYQLTRGEIPPSPPYFAGRFSNGRVWIEYLREDFEAQGRGFRNYAVGGSTMIAAIQAQIGVFALERRETKGAAASLWAASNDLKMIADNQGGSRLSRRLADAAARAVADSVGASVRLLADQGIEQFVLPNVAPLGAIPRYAHDRPQRVDHADRVSEIYNRRLHRIIQDLQADGLKVVEIDVHALFRDAVENPGKYGLENVTDRCLSPTGIVCENPDRYLFWDDQHPSAAAHRILAGLVREQVQPIPAVSSLTAEIAPVPLPAPAWLLLAGLAGLGLLRGRAGLRPTTPCPAVA